MVPAEKEHVLNVTRQWLDPDRDGDPIDGFGGFRLDVAAMVPLGFWHDYRPFVRAINPDAYLAGEVRWESWPDPIMDSAPWLQCDVFDAVMNYRWYMPTRSLFAGTSPYLTASTYVGHLDSIGQGVDAGFQKAMMNRIASHDTLRFGTSVYNPGRFKYRANPSQNPGSRIDRPDERARVTQRFILVQPHT